MFSGSLFGALYRSSGPAMEGLSDQQLPVAERSLIHNLASLLGLIKGTILTPKSFLHRDGFCFVAPVPKNIKSEQNAGRILVYENGLALAHPQSMHEDISIFGRGRYSYWNNQLFFSSSDNTDPTKNGRRYEIVRK